MKLSYPKLHVSRGRQAWSEYQGVELRGPRSAGQGGSTDLAATVSEESAELADLRASQSQKSPTTWPPRHRIDSHFIGGANKTKSDHTPRSEHSLCEWHQCLACWVCLWRVVNGLLFPSLSSTNAEFTQSSFYKVVLPLEEHLTPTLTTGDHVRGNSLHSLQGMWPTMVNSHRALVLLWFHSVWKFHSSGLMSSSFWDLMNLLRFSLHSHFHIFSLGLELLGSTS